MIIREANILTDNRIYYPSAFRIVQGHAAPIPAVSSINAFSWPTAYEAVLEKCWRELFGVIGEQTRCVIFCAQGCFQYLNVVVKSRGLWKGDVRLEKVKEAALEVGQEYSLNIGNRIRYYGMAVILWRDALPALKAIYNLGSCFMLLGYDSASDRELAPRLFQFAFGRNPESNIEWPDLIISVVKLGGRVIRVAGTADDKELSIDIFG